MTGRVPCPPAPGPLEGCAARFDDLFRSLAQWRGFREYLTGLLLPRDRNKTLTVPAGAESVTGAQHPGVQRRQFFLSEPTWEYEQGDTRRLELLAADPATAPHGRGVLVIDDSGGPQGRHGDRPCRVAVAGPAWEDGQWRRHGGHALGGRAPLLSAARPACTPARHFPRKRNDPDFRTRPQLATDLAGQAHEAGFTFRAVVADCGYGGHDEVRHTLREAGLPFVMALKPRRGTWACKDEAHTPVDAARALTWTDPERPGDWAPVVRTFRDGHTETWWAADARLGGWGPDGSPRPVVAVVDPGALPEKATWYPAANLSRPGSPRTADSPHPPAGPGPRPSAQSGPGSTPGTPCIATGMPGRNAPATRTPSSHHLIGHQSNP